MYGEHVGFKRGERVMCRGRLATVVRTQREDSDIVYVSPQGGSPVWRRASDLTPVVEGEVGTEDVLHPHHLPGDATEPL